MIVYVDMDHVLADYDAGFEEWQKKFPHLEFPQSQPGMYIALKPLPGAIEAMKTLFSWPDVEVYILSAPSVKNAHSYTEKREWVERYLGEDACDRLILSGHKGLNQGDFLIDDQAEGKGQEMFAGELIQFGTSKYATWQDVLDYLQAKLPITAEAESA